MSPSNHAFSAVSFITFLLVLVPLSWHLQAWNTGTVLYITWTALSLLNLFINSIVWDKNAIDWAPVWCDISSKLVVGAAIGIPCASLCINRRLYYIAAVQTVTKSKSDKIRGVVMDLCIGVGIPIVMMALHYVVQGHRYDVFGDIGCWPATYNVTLQYLLIQTPILIIPLVSGTFAIMSILAFRERQAEFRAILSSSAGNLTANRYFRLMALASVEVVAGLPLTVTSIIMNATLSPVQPWISWEDTHYNFSRVLLIPAVLWRSDPSAEASLEMTRWLTICCGLIFFGFFGFADEARRNYKLVADKIGKLLGVEWKFGGETTRLASSPGTSYNSSSNSSTDVGSSRGGGLPILVQKEVIKKRDSLDSMSDMTSLGSADDDDDEVKKAAGLAPEYDPYAPSTSSVRIEISPPLYPGEGADARFPFPTSVTPTGSFLDLTTPSAESALRNPDLTRADNRV